jgi:nicotinamidase-related amidase
MRGGVVPKNILLIIDPQNDFTDDSTLNIENVANPNDPKLNIGDLFTGNQGALSVGGAMADYEKIAKFIENNKDKIDEIHVSLDTHTPMHIGNLAFWERWDDSKHWIPLDRTDAISIIKLEELDNQSSRIIGTSLVGKYDGTRIYTPADPNLLPYVTQYINNYSEGKKSATNKHSLSPIIWNTHCLEKSEGHKIHSKIQAALKNFTKTIRYHIKGQNNMAEMYSIFSAEQPFTQATLNTYTVTIQNTDTIQNTNIYAGKNKGKDPSTSFQNIMVTKNHDPVNGAPTYDQAINEVNLDTTLNTAFLDYLLGSKETPNLVIVCGEAKTHCVKSSMIDMLEYQQNVRKQSCSNIILLTDCSSPIPGPEDNLAEIVSSSNGYTSAVSNYECKFDGKLLTSDYKIQ